MSTLFNEFDVLFQNLFSTEGAFAPVNKLKSPHPVNIFYDSSGLHLEVACTGLTKKDVTLLIEDDLLKITHKRTEEEKFHPGTICKGLSKKSFDLGYKISSKYNLAKTEAKLENGLLEIFIPMAEESKPKFLQIK